MLKYLYLVITFDNTEKRNIEAQCFGTERNASQNAYNYLKRKYKEIINNSEMDNVTKKRLLKTASTEYLRDGYHIELDGVEYDSIIEKYEINADIWEINENHIYTAIATVKNRPDISPAYGVYMHKKEALKDKMSEKDKNIKTQIIKLPIQKNYIKIVC